MADGLSALVAGELDSPVDPKVAAMAEAIAERHRPASTAVIFYGSCLRQKQLDGLMLDFYLVVSDYGLAYDRRWLATANRLVPPNVFYFASDGLSAKYAVLSEADLRRECGPGATSVSVLARFAQPARLAWAKDGKARQAVVDAVARCAPTLLARTVPMAPEGAAMIDLWKRAFQLTFACELRAERGDRSGQIVDSDAGRYADFGEASKPLPAVAGGESRRWWKRMKRRGKILSIVRLAKASKTFAGGADYIAWKINRHAGTKIELKPWQRRWPLLAGLTLLPRLLKKGAVR